MGSAVERLTKLVEDKDRYDIPYADLLPMQIAAADERLKERVGVIKLLANRAETGGIKTVRDPADLVPLLFAHTTYKSYPESWFTQGKWDRMGQWLDTVSTYPVRGVDTKDIKDIDEWLERLEAAGYYVSCSSGTTGKCSMIPAGMADRTFGQRNHVAITQWMSGIQRGAGYKFIGMTPIAKSVRARDGRTALFGAFGSSDRPFTNESITVGQVSQMVALRRKIGDGTARPAEIAAFEATSAAREKMIEAALVSTAEAIVESRSEKMFFMGMFATMFRIAEMIRNMGYSAKDFHPENALLSAGGLKGAVLPADYRERIFETLNIQPQRVCQSYGMQELNGNMPRCAAGRYHVPPWNILLLLDQTGDQLIRPGSGEIEGRAGFFDLSLDGRWCGVISGDKIKVDYGKCACGHQGPTVNNDIVRYSELPDGDKIACSGTIDAYIRGAA
ncbi:MAG: hypothetical protein EPO08_02830 [Rhodospirillaceae bacterium]|nr:MAG: hypothetical protein EPO08_02830 [Rhodospirillaceae bacterium]